MPSPRAEIYRRTAIAYDEDGGTEVRIAAAQAADELLSIKGVDAAFTLFTENGGVNVSARSLGDFNVQLVMEAIGGGGHLTMAGAMFVMSFFVSGLFTGFSDLAAMQVTPLFGTVVRIPYLLFILLKYLLFLLPRSRWRRSGSIPPCLTSMPRARPSWTGKWSGPASSPALWTATRGPMAVCWRCAAAWGWPGGEKKERPRRPFPADWLSAMTTVPSTAPAFASSLALSLVEVSSE